MSGATRRRAEAQKDGVDSCLGEKTYVMTGTQPIRIGRLVLEPGSGEFVAALEPVEEEFFVRIGAIKVKE